MIKIFDLSRWLSKIPIDTMHCVYRWPRRGEINKNKLTEELDVQWFTAEPAANLPLRWAWLKDFFSC